jgi:hypothetical protein
MELTQQTVETALYEGRSHMSKSGRKRWSQHVLWDDRLPGFGLRITPTNRKSFIVSYRAAGRKRTKNIGRAGKLKLDEARRRAAEFLAAVAEEQPGAATRPPRVEGVATVAQLADAYLEQHLKGKVPSWYADQRLVQVHIKPSMGRASIAEVTQADLTNLRSRIGRRFPADARRLAVLLGGMFDWAAENGLWSKSSRASASASAAGSRHAPEPAGEPVPPPTAAELREGLERSETERRDLAERLDEVSASGAEMLARLGEQAAARRELETELARARRELDRARAGTAGPQAQEASRKQLANLRQSVEQLMASLQEARDEREEMAERLADLEVQDKARAKKTAALMRRRNELEARLLEEERQVAILKSQRDAGGGRVALWLTAGAIGGALLTFVALWSLEPGRAMTRVTAGPPAATTAGGTYGPVADLGRAAGELPADPGPGVPAAAADPGPAGEAEQETGDGSPAEPTDSGSAPDFAVAEAAVRSWAAAWSEQSVDDYLAAYSEQFVPPDGLERREWAARRRDRVQRPAWIRVTLGDMRQTVLGASRVRVDFEQRYETGSYADVVRKSLELVWEAGGWQIAAERVL